MNNATLAGAGRFGELLDEALHRRKVVAAVVLVAPRHDRHVDPPERVAYRRRHRIDVEVGPVEQLPDP